MSVSDEIEGPEFLEEYVAYLSHRIGSLMDQDINLHLREVGISLEMFRVLFILAHVGDHNLVALSRATGVKTSTLSRLIGRMSKRGLVSRVRSPRDNRTVNVSIKEDGRNIVSQLTPYVSEFQNMMVSDFSAEEIPVLKSYLRRLYRTMQENDRKTSA